MMRAGFAGADVRSATTTFTVLNDSGKIVTESVVETTAKSPLTVVKALLAADV
jgi:hypothetical protein